jgi:dTDP-4-dehydrorhamnose 3,5-epimerase
MLYCHSQAYAPQSEAGLHPQDPRLAIAWPLPVLGLSARDASHPALGDDFQGVRL